ncbi:MAG: hypothetical protein ACXWNE_09215 [Candidatus Binataceae bacterium]
MEQPAQPLGLGQRTHLGARAERNVDQHVVGAAHSFELRSTPK